MSSEMTVLGRPWNPVNCLTASRTFSLETKPKVTGGKVGTVGWTVQALDVLLL